MKVVEVEWLDAHSGTHETTLDRAKSNKPVITRTVGYLLAENDHGITLISDYWPGDPDKGAIEHFVGWGMISQWWIYT